VLREGLVLALVGLAVGAAGAAALSRLLRSLLYEVGPHDLPTYASVAIVLAAVAAGASFFPAWRASREDAAVALRAE
jgi:ABC-type antimicrobial peptide transport system permease subunit